MEAQGPDGLQVLALKHGIKIRHDNGKRKRKADLMETIKTHFKALNKTEDTIIHDSDCYLAPVQRIYRKRKVIEQKPTKNCPEAKSNKRSRKKLPQAFAIANVTFKGRCFFVDRLGGLRCHCYSRYKGNMDTNGLNSHANTVIPKKWKARCEEDQQHHAWIEEVATADNGNLHLHIHYVQNMLACGIPLDKTNGVLRRFIQIIYGCPLSESTHLKNEYIPKIIKMEHDMVTE
jgi:hypothetical protein